MDAKSQGNKAYAEHRWEDAVRLYTQALAVDPGLAAAYSNRAACWIQLHQWGRGLADCDAGLDLHDASLAAKLYYRKAVCEKELGMDYSQSVAAGLAIEPHNQSLLALQSPHQGAGKSGAGQSGQGSLQGGTEIEIKIVDKLPSKFTTKKESKAEFVLPKLPLTYAAVQSLVRQRTPEAMDFVYNLDPSELINAHKGIGIEPETIDYVNEVAGRGDKGQRLKEALRQCDGYEAVSFLI